MQTHPSPGTALRQLMLPAIELHDTSDLTEKCWSDTHIVNLCSTYCSNSGERYRVSREWHWAPREQVLPRRLSCMGGGCWDSIAFAWSIFGMALSNVFHGGTP